MDLRADLEWRSVNGRSKQIIFLGIVAISGVSLKVLSKNNWAYLPQR